MTIAALLTCHNRKVKTLKCLDSLFAIDSSIEIYLTDDGCTDGTSEEVQRNFPKIHIIRGDGGLFWNRGMYAAWKEALKGGYDYYLWLNDDVELYADSLEELKNCNKEGTAIVSGIVEDCNHENILYGGFDVSKQLIIPKGKPQKIRWMNGNVVLVPKSVVEKIGILDPYFIHDLGDVDYGMRAQKNGIEVLSTGKPIASGYRNDICRIRKWNSSLLDRFKALNMPLGSPLRQNFHFRYRHFGLIHALAYNGKIILLNLLPDCLVTKIFTL